MLFRNHLEALDTTAATLRCGHPSDHKINAVPTTRVGAEVPRRGVPVIPAKRAGSTA
jgi:hypothetical protein